MSMKTGSLIREFNSNDDVNDFVSYVQHMIK